MKTICIFHNRDLDGWMSAAIVKKWFIENNEQYFIKDLKTTSTEGSIKQSDKTNNLFMLGWDYGDEIPDLSDYDKIIMCDVSFPKEIMLNITKQKQSKFIWIDHHKRTIDEVMVYLYNNKLTEPSGLRTKSFQLESACELTWKYFFPNEEIPEIVRLLGMYDSFRHKGTNEEQKVLEFQYGARIEITNYESAYNLLKLKYKRKYEKAYFNVLDSILIRGRDIYNYLKQEAKQIYSKAFEINFNNELLKLKLRQKGVSIKPSMIKKSIIGYKFLCVNQERFNPVNFGIDYHKEGYDGFACFWYNNGKWNFNLYNDNGEVDCSIIAKQYGGGGHKGAAGFVCNNEIMLKIINNDN